MNKTNENQNDASNENKSSNSKPAEISLNFEALKQDKQNSILRGTDLMEMIQAEGDNRISSDSSLEFYNPKSSLRDLKRYPDDLDGVDGDDAPFGAALIKMGISI